MPQLGLGAHYQLRVVAYTDDLHSSIKDAMEVIDNGWREFHRLLLVRSMGRVNAAEIPVFAGVHPCVETFFQKIIDHLGCNSNRNQQLLNYSREVGLNEHAAIECRDRSLQFEYFG